MSFLRSNSDNCVFISSEIDVLALIFADDGGVSSLSDSVVRLQRLINLQCFVRWMMVGSLVVLGLTAL